ncbi:tetraspanin-18-like [Mercenaria mercenaria]|uniref:tetraspanin-18-like n=1 Tax=Mercenaria mercenaria TaxID=6596 RepID=UPI001E1DC4EE|nr:tetraspanin-18-like [Mercenaria mercenaria]
MACMRKQFQSGPDNSILSFLANLGIVVLCLINLVFLLLGIGVIIIADRLDKEIDKHEDIMNLLDLVEFGTFTLKQLINAIIVAVILCGVFAIVTSLIGGVGAFFTLRILLILYMVIVIICIIVELYALSLWIDLLEKVDNTLRGWFEKLLKEYKGSAVADVYSLGWDFIFIFFGCCGVDPVTMAHNDFQTLPTIWWSSGDHGSDVIPASCCHDVTVENYLNYNNTDCTVNMNSYHTSGCYDIFDEIFTRLASAAISIITIICIIEGVAIFFSVVIIIAVSTRKKVGLV